MLLALLLTIAPAAAPAETLRGPARVMDGDTLAIGGRVVRLFGIDAPELAQMCGGRPCGRDARAALVALIAGHVVACRVRNVDPYGRAIGLCVAGGRSLNRAMVARGQAIAYRRFSLLYVGAEQVARAARCGLWAGDFMTPEAWRRIHGRGSKEKPRRSGADHRE